MIPQYEPLLTRADARAAARVIRSGWIGPGRECEAFKRNFHKILPYESAITLTNSGTSALMAGMAALDLPIGSLVLCPAYGMHAAANVALKLGMWVELVDIEPKNRGMSLNALRDAINKFGDDVRMVVLIRENGFKAEHSENIAAICGIHGICLIDDACQATKHDWSDEFYPDFSVVSFSPHKIITTGQGGAICVNGTKKPMMASRVEQYVQCGRCSGRDETDGLNLRMSDINAAVGNSQMARYSKIVHKRDRIHQWYMDEFRRQSFYLDEWLRTGWFVTVDQPATSALIPFLRAYGIEAKKLYRPTNHYPQFAHCKGPFPEAETAARETIYLPSSLTLTRRQVRRVVHAISKFYETTR